MEKFSIREIVRKSWETLFKYPGTFFATIIFLGVISSLYQLLLEPTIGNLLQSDQFIIGIIVGTLSAISYVALIAIVKLGMIKISLMASRNIEPTFNDVFSFRLLRNILVYIGVNLLVISLALLGYVALIVPGVIVQLAFLFSVYAYVDNPNLGVWESMTKSRHITKGYRWKLLLLVMVVGAIKIAGLFAFGVGIIIAEPLTWIILGHAYTKLSSLHSQ